MRDVSSFKLGNCTDTCAVWNVLSSAVLARATFASKCAFAITSYVLYECLHKPRSRIDPSDVELQQRLRREREAGRFTEVSIEIEDVQALAALPLRKRLGHGELSAIAFARRARTAFLSDDRGAQRFAEELLGREAVQTTPQLLGWLVFRGVIVDSQIDVICAEHAAVERKLGKPFRLMYEEGMRCRLMVKGMQS
jgi:hypothetical protein